MVLWCTALLSLPLVANAHQPKFSPAQMKAAQEAYHLAEPYGLGLTFTALVYQESSLCANKIGIDPYGNGCTQIHRSTAQKYSNVYLHRQFLRDDNLSNMRYGLEELTYCRGLYGDWASMLVCYKYGPGSVDRYSIEDRQNNEYVIKIRAKVKELSSFGIVVVPLPSK